MLRSTGRWQPRADATPTQDGRSNVLFPVNRAARDDGIGMRPHTRPCDLQRVETTHHARVRRRRRVWLASFERVKHGCRTFRLFNRRPRRGGDDYRIIARAPEREIAGAKPGPAPRGRTGRPPSQHGRRSGPPPFLAGIRAGRPRIRHRRRTSRGQSRNLLPWGRPTGSSGWCCAVRPGQREAEAAAGHKKAATSGSRTNQIAGGSAGMALGRSPVTLRPCLSTGLL